MNMNMNKKKARPYIYSWDEVRVVIFYLCCQKYIIKGVAAGAVKG